MAQTFKYTQNSIWRTSEVGVTSASAAFQSESEVKSPPVSGGFITLPDGSKFRKPTAYVHKKYGWTGVTPQDDTGYHSVPSHTRNTMTTVGGYRASDLMASNCPNISGISLNRLYDTPVIPTMMRNEAVTKALEDIADQKANIAENLATFRQTLQLLKGPGWSLVNSIKNFRRDLDRDKHFLWHTIRDLRRGGIPEWFAEKYIAYVYGWRPLMQDIYGIMEMAKGQSSRPLLLTGEGVSNQQVQTRTATYANVSNKCITTLGPCDEKVKVSCQIHGRIDPDHAGLRSVNQLGLLNPASLAWELVKWSFVIDWFIPIGSVLNALSAPAGLKFVAGTVSVRTKMTGPFTHYDYQWRDGNSGNKSLTKQDATGLVYHEGYNRTVLTNWPLPGFWFSSDPFAGDRGLKALALGILSLRSSRIL